MTEREKKKSIRAEFEERIDRMLSGVSECSKAVEAELGELTGAKGELSGISKELERVKERLGEKKRLSKERQEEIRDAIEILEEALEAKRKKVKERSTGKEDEYLNSLKYLKADFENYKRRTEKDKREFGEYLIKGFITDLLPIKDGLEVATGHARANENSEWLLKGVEMTVKQITEQLKREGLEEIHAEGEQFDPFKHEVIAKETVEDPPENTVIKVMRKGYIFRGKVIRPAMVKIAVKDYMDKQAR